jgi:hypothetical protein
MKNRLASIKVKLIKGEPLREYLGNWTLLSMKFRDKDFTEAELMRLLKLEIIGKCRRQMIERIYSKFNTVRRHREMEEIADVIRETHRKETV